MKRKFKMSSSIFQNALKAPLAAFALLSMVGTSYAWDEKWPITFPINQENFVSAFLRAHFGKIGEIVAGKLDDILKDPKKQAKLTAAIAEKLNDIYAKYERNKVSNEEAARKAAVDEFIAAIEGDISIPTGIIGPMGLQAAHAPNYGVVRLTWDRQRVQNAQCSKTVCVCPNTGFTVQLGSSCGVYSSGGFAGQPILPRCDTSWDTLDLEAGYQVYRNGRLIASFEERRSVIGSREFSTSAPLGPVSINLKYSVPRAPEQLSTRVGPFYDLDAQNFDIGSPLTYKVVASRQGCGPYGPGLFYSNSTFHGLQTESQVTVDADGDGTMDWLPPSDAALIRRYGPPSLALEATAGSGGSWTWDPSSVLIRLPMPASGGTVSATNKSGKKVSKIVSAGIVVFQPSDFYAFTPNRTQEDTFVFEFSGDSINSPAWSKIIFRMEAD